MLELKDVVVGYGPIRAVDGVSLRVAQGSITTILGANGAGKSSCLKAISGLVPAQSGTITFKGQPIQGLSPEQRLRLGIAHVMEGRRLFADQSVEDNLLLGAYALRHESGARDATRARREHMYQRFPILHTRKSQPALTLSGGEQQMLAIAVALMSRPSLLLLDEPSLGLAPKMVQAVGELIRELRTEGMTVLLVEQLASMALSLADHAYALRRGRVVLSGTAAEMLKDMKYRDAYFGSEPTPAGAPA